MHKARTYAIVLAVAGLSGLPGCASQDTAGRDPHPVAPFPWCADEARAAASQPLPRNATREQKEAARDYHMSQACQRALQTEAEVRIQTGAPRPSP